MKRVKKPTDQERCKVMMPREHDLFCRLEGLPEDIAMGAVLLCRAAEIMHRIRPNECPRTFGSRAAIAFQILLENEKNAKDEGDA